MTALLVTIVIYATFRGFRNIPGLNILFLSVALFTAQLLMLIAPSTEKEPIVCKIFAIGMHYFFLAAFLWMNVIAIDAWSTFSRKLIRVKEPRQKNRQFLMYSMYAWMSPLVPIVSALTLDYVDPASVFSPGYGLGICWITRKLSLLIFFAAPLAMVVVLNTIFFICTSTTICSVKISSARTLGPEQRNEFLIYVKLFIVMGLTWGFGFLSAFVPHPVTTYLYIVTNTLQGLFIGISFVCTRKVLRHLQDYRDRFDRQRTNDQHFSTFNTQSTHM
ncbi:G-protein coupled receptor Mth2-like [Haliotis rufescens]|uniref:G-protein coupled receptor Mth2-like n=1 Tax=Haliotis rufescens TaxID=6454 RepID=UPI00201F493C|nr:G-protein coupled receptor Mth2-like [Haliotis rufescens]